MSTSSQQRVAAVVNPVAGGGRALERWRRVEADLALHGIHPVTRITRMRGHATEISRQLADEGYTTIVAAGGDGTVHEVVNGLLSLASQGGKVHLGVVPAGTGMDFVRNARLPHSPRAIARAIAAGRTTSLDVGVGSWTDRKVFVNFAETGLGAAVVAREARFADAWPGRLSYLLAAVGAAIAESKVEALVSVGGTDVYSGPLVSAIVANGRYFGGGLKIAPLASMTDGQFDVLILGDFSRAQLVSQIWKIYPGLHVNHPKVLWLRGSNVQIRPTAPTPLDLDGELHGPGSYSFEILARSLQVLR